MSGCYEVVCEDTSLLERPEWLILRKAGIGSSDAAPCMSMSPWSSAYSVWAEKSGYLPDSEDNERLLWGRLHEPLILNQAHLRGWIKGPIRTGLMLRSTEYPWMLANPDGLGPSEVVEAKTADGWDEPRWDIGVPDQYVIQAHHLMIVTGTAKCTFPVLFGGNNLRWFVVEFDHELGEQVIAGTRAMWERIQNADPPDPDASEASMMALRQVYTEVVEGKVCDLPDEMHVELAARAISAKRIKHEKEQIDALKARIMHLMGDAEVASHFAAPVATWKKDKNGKRRFLWKEDSE